MKQLDINTLGKMAQTLLVAGVAQKNIPATINHLVTVLFRYGHEVAVTEVCDEFFGTWELAYDGDSFTIELTR